jgi:hypothetical protein
MKFTPEVIAALDAAASMKADQIIKEGWEGVDVSDYDKGISTFQRMLGVSKMEARMMMDYCIEKTNSFVRAVRVGTEN